MWAMANFMHVLAFYTKKKSFGKTKQIWFASYSI